jgi:exosome complex component CSL4
MVSITVVDGVPLPAGEEFTGMIRSQDVRATEKDRVKIGDCFRGGDVIRGLVVRSMTAFLRYPRLIQGTDFLG